MAENLSQKTLSRSRIPQIELVRAIAMAGIFVFHLWSVVPNVAESGPLGRSIAHASSFGYLGVVLFNFISGFVLALPYLGPKQRGIPPYPNFLHRRFKRIAPKYYLALTFWAGVLLLWGKVRSDSLLPDYLAHLAFIHSIFPAMFFSIVPAYWWLGILAQFYLLFPILLRFFKMFGAARACLLVCLTSWVCWVVIDLLSHPDSSWALVNYMLYYNMPARLPEFAIGMWLAEAWHAGNSAESPARTSWHTAISPAYKAFVGAALLFAIAGSSIVPLEGLPLRHICMVCWCLAGFVAVLLLDLSRRLGQTLMVAKFAAASYSIYLLHQPLLGYANRLLGDMLQPQAEFALLLVVVGAASFALAATLDRFVI